MNTGALVALGIFFAGIIYKLIALHVGHSDLFEEVKGMRSKYDGLRSDADKHIYDPLRHLDPVRDAKLQRETERRLQRIEDKLDALLAVKPLRGRFNSGDDDETH